MSRWRVPSRSRRSTISCVADAPGCLPRLGRRGRAAARVIPAGAWLSAARLFFPGRGREVAEAELPDGWVELRGDWIVDEETVSGPRLLTAAVLAGAVRRVHAAGGRVAIHAMRQAVCRTAVGAGQTAWSTACGWAMTLLPRMAAQGTALVLACTSWAGQMKEIRALRPPARQWFPDGYARLGPPTLAAHAAGVAVLAGTDFRPHGTIAAKVRHLAAAANRAKSPQ